MTGERRPLLALGSPERSQRRRRKPSVPPRVVGPGTGRQGERISPQFRALVDAFDAERASVAVGRADSIDPELVLVFDLAGSVQDFRNAVSRVSGLEFLSELVDADIEADDDFHLTDARGRIDGAVQHSLYLVMSNATAVTQLLNLFNQWRDEPQTQFAYGLGRFKSAFQQLRAIRRWSPEDRVRDTGLLEAWRQHLELVGQSVSTLPAEIELWFRNEPAQRQLAEAQLRRLVESAGGTVVTRAVIEPISYHAILVDLPVQQVERVLRDGAASIELLNANEIMFASPYAPMSVLADDVEPEANVEIVGVEEIQGQARIALLDGLPFESHDALKGRLAIDDPDGLSEIYPLASRNHGTAMASLIIHGDLSGDGTPLDRPLYVRPILEPHPMGGRGEISLSGRLLTDLLHSAIRRIVEGEGRHAAAAPSTRIVNLSIGAESRALVRRMSPLGRLIDWMSFEFNLLFVVSAGNHLGIPLIIPSEAATNEVDARVAAARSSAQTAIMRGILPPGDAVNALTVGASHSDESGFVASSDNIWDITEPGAPAHYGAVGPGVGRSIKPDVYNSGGRALYRRPVIDDSPQVTLELAQMRLTGPGHLVAAPKLDGSTAGSVYTHGTSNAAALTTREASHVFEILEAGRDSIDDYSFPDSLYHPVLTKALLVHSSEWGQHSAVLTQALGLSGRPLRRDLTAVLGYGGLRPERVGRAATNRAVLIAGGSIGRDERHTFEVPLPISLHAKSEWHRFTVTLAYVVPTSGRLNQYRGARVFFEKLDDATTGGTRIEVEWTAVRRGSVQHEIVDGTQAMAIAQGDSIPIHVECMDKPFLLNRGESIRYGLVVSVETTVATSTTIHQEIRSQLQARARTEVQRPRVTP